MPSNLGKLDPEQALNGEFLSLIESIFPFRASRSIFDGSPTSLILLFLSAILGDKVESF